MNAANQWTDGDKNVWSIRVDVESIRRVRKQTGYDLAQLFTEAGLGALASDVVLLVDVLFSCVEPQAIAKGITPEAFGRAQRSEALALASDALIEGAIDFLEPGRAAVLARLRDKSREAAKAMELQLMAAVENLGIPSPNSGATSPPMPPIAG